MEAIDVVLINSAKDWLNISDEEHIKRLIKSAVDWVERYTGYYLFDREMTIQIPFSGYGVTKYPLDIISVKNKDGEELSYETKKGVYSTFVFAPSGSYLTANVGYTSSDDIPPILVEACYKMLTYLYENRDIYAADQPTDIQRMINKYRRNLV